MTNTQFHPLTKNDLKHLDFQRDEITRHLSDDDKSGAYATAMGKLTTLKILLDTNIFNAEHTHELQCMGVILGDIFVLENNFRWVIAEDHYGRTPAIVHNNEQLTFFPVTMISKRIERGEKVDIVKLYRKLCNQINSLIADYC